MNRDKSFIDILNRNGPDIEPSGTPLFILSKNYSDLIFEMNQ